MLVSCERYLVSCIHFTFYTDMTEVEQRYVIKFLSAKPSLSMESSQNSHWLIGNKSKQK
jgi:hypothetical protein